MATSVGSHLVSGEKTVTTSGTALPLEGSGTVAAPAISRKVSSVLIIAKAGNTNNVYIGGPDIATTTNDGLAAGKFIILPGPLDTGLLFLDVDTNGEGVDFYATL